MHVKAGTCFHVWMVLSHEVFHNISSGNCSQAYNQEDEKVKKEITDLITLSKRNLLQPIEDSESLWDPTRTKLLVRTALGPPGLAKAVNGKKWVIFF